MVGAGVGQQRSTSGQVAIAAPLSRRLGARLIDVGIDLFPAVVLALVHGSLGGTTAAAGGMTLVATIAIGIVNEIVLVVRYGQSVGKQLLAIKIVDSTAMTPPAFWQTLWRNVVQGGLGGIGWHPFGGGIGFLVVLSPWPIVCYWFAITDRQWHRGLHDRWAHTVVIDVRNG